MAPTKGTTRTTVTTQATLNAIMPLGAVRGKGLSRRGVNNIDANVENMQTRSKRKADNSPIKNDKIKRSALGNLTNNVKIMSLHANEEDSKQHQLKKPTAQQIQALVDAKKSDNLNILNAARGVSVPALPIAPVNKVVTRAALKIEKEGSNENRPKVLANYDEQLAQQRPRRAAAPAKKPVAQIAVPPLAPMIQPVQKLAVSQANVNKPVRRISNDFNKTEESLYMSALEDVSTDESTRRSANFEAARRRSTKLQQNIKTEEPQVKTNESGANKTECDALQTQRAMLKAAAAAAMVMEKCPVPEGVEDFDKVNWDDPFQVSHYSTDIFNYLKMRESNFIIKDYMPTQIHLTTWMRTLLVDWMVEVQETFELNHETLYLAVKIVDHFLCRELIAKEKLQLLGAAAIFIACKYDERQPPIIDDFLYICDGAYNNEELVKMEMETLRVINFDLGIPISYRFLRRYARCARVPMPILTLGRYILEFSLMDYATIMFSDSQMASAALYMALRMYGRTVEETWTPTLIHYTGYKLEDFAEIVHVLNTGLNRKPRSAIKTIRNKYSHKIFHEAAKVPVLSNEEMLPSHLNVNNNNNPSS